MEVIKIPKDKNNFLWRFLGFVEKTLDKKYCITYIGAMLGIIFSVSLIFPIISFLIEDPFIVTIFATLTGLYVAWVAKRSFKTLKDISDDKCTTKFS